MSLVQITPPAAEPVSISELKEHFRVTGAAEDGSIAAFGLAARQTIEARFGVAIVTQIWRLSLDCPFGNLASGEIILPLSPVASVDSVAIVDADGNSEALDPGAYEVDGDAPARIRFKNPAALNAPFSRNGGGLRVVFTAGWDESQVPENIKLALKILAAGFFEAREAVGPDRLYTAPGGVDALLAKYRQVRLRPVQRNEAPR